MFVWSDAVFDLDSQYDHNKRQDPHTLRKSKDLSPSEILTAVGTTFNVFGTVWTDHRTHLIPDGKSIGYVLY